MGALVLYKLLLCVAHTLHLEDSGLDVIVVDQRFDWPVARPVEETEVLIIELHVRSRLFADKLLGTYGLVLQSVIRDGRLSVSDDLVDPNNKPLPVKIEFDVLYSLPDASTASFADSQAYNILEDDQQMLIDIEQNIANLERTLATDTRDDTQHAERENRTMKRGSSLTVPDKSPIIERYERKRSSALRSVRNLMRLGKQRPPKESDNEGDTASLIHDSAANSAQHSESESTPMSRAGSQTSISSGDDILAISDRRGFTVLALLNSSKPYLICSATGLLENNLANRTQSLSISNTNSTSVAVTRRIP
ncbi:hypothetical protein Trydic_g17181 [Trypoxylus dichotomus]